MQLMDAIVERRAVREYEDAVVDWRQLKEIINAAILAPSARNRQPWAFAVQLKADRVDEYALQAKNWLLSSSGEDFVSPELRELLASPGYNLFHHAAALVLVLATAADPEAAQDCCLAAENLMLAARDVGLGTCWIGLARPWFNLPETKAVLKLPDTYQVVAPIVIGHPRAWPSGVERNPAEIHCLD